MILIVGCGNTLRKDDGVGIYVLDLLRMDRSIAGRADIKLLDAGTSGMDLIYQMRNFDCLIIIDASHSGSPPGSVFVTPGEKLESPPDSKQNLHGFRWDHAIYVGRRTYAESFPKKVAVYLVEAEDCSYGMDLSFSVSTAALKVAELIKAELLCRWQS